MGAARNPFAHLSWRGRREVAWYAVRRLVIAPAPDDQRCRMGAPVAPEVWCPRRAVTGDRWLRVCAVHAKEAAS